MAKGRPAKANSIYKVSVHVNNGRSYAVTHPYSVGEDGKRRYSYKNWGSLEDGNRFHPNSAYFYASLEERRKLIFPADWDLSEIEALSGRGIVELLNTRAETWTGCTALRGSLTMSPGRPDC